MKNEEERDVSYIFVTDDGACDDAADRHLKPRTLLFRVENIEGMRDDFNDFIKRLSMTRRNPRVIGSVMQKEIIEYSELRDSSNDRNQ